MTAQHNNGLTREQRYLQSGGTQCPNCESAVIEATPITGQGTTLGYAGNATVTQLMICYDCAASWADRYRLVGVTQAESFDPSEVVSTTEHTQIALVQITGTDSDIAVYLNGKQIVSADPGTHDNTDDVRETAHNLSIALGAPVIDMAYTAVNSSWDWNLVAEELKDNGSMMSSD